MISNVTFSSRTLKRFPKMAAPKVPVRPFDGNVDALKITVKNREVLPWEELSSKVCDGFVASAKDRSKPIV